MRASTSRWTICVSIWSLLLLILTGCDESSPQESHPEIYNRILKLLISEQKYPLSLAATCTTQIGSGTTVIDDQSNCYEKFGTASYWHESTGGYGNHFWWTNTTSSGSPDNYSKWTLNIIAAGNYEISVYIPSTNATSRLAKYEIYHNGQSSYYTINQYNYSNQWVSLGTYYFNASATQYVRLNDNTGESTSYKIASDAVQIVNQSGTNHPPNAFSKIYPANNAGVTNYTVTFQWNAATDPDGDTVTYDLIVHDGNQNNVSGCVFSGLTTTSKSCTLPTGNGLNYYWYVKAKDGKGGETEADSPNPWSFFWTNTNRAPNAFSKTAPANNAGVTSYTVNFQWNAATDPDGDTVTYDLIVHDGNQNNVSGCVFSGLTTTSKSCTLPTGNGLNYYWYVKAKDGKGGETEADSPNPWSFFWTNMNRAPNAFSKTAPANNAGVTSYTVNFQWNAATDPDGDTVTYDLIVHDGNQNNVSGCVFSGLTTTSKSCTLPTGNGLNYYWYVKAKDGKGGETEADSPNPWSFFWTNTNRAPDAFSKIAPANNAGVTSYTVNFQWNAAADPDGDTVTYDLIVHDGNQNNVSGCVFTDLTTTSKSCTLPTGKGQQYYWYVKAKDGKGGETEADSPNPWSLFWTNINQAPNAFSKIAPANNAGVTSYTVNFQWNAATDPDGDTVKYDLTVHDANGGDVTGCVFTDLLTTSKSCTLPTGNNQQYYWYVKAKDGNGGETEADATNPWSLFWTNTNRPPNAFGKTTPANNAGVGSYSVNFHWNAATDPDGDLVKYDLIVHDANGNNISGCGFVDLTTTFKSCTLPSGNNQQYYWYVKAKDGNGGETEADATNPWWLLTVNIDTSGVKHFADVEMSQLTQYFGDYGCYIKAPNKYHTGVDWGISEWTQLKNPFRSALVWKLKDTDGDSDSWGKLLLLKHEADPGEYFYSGTGEKISKFYSFAAHLNQIQIIDDLGITHDPDSIIPGETKVGAYANIGKSGKKGTGPHLHEEFRIVTQDDEPWADHTFTCASNVPYWPGCGYETSFGNTPWYTDSIEFVQNNKTHPISLTDLAFYVHTYNSYDNNKAYFFTTGDGWNGPLGTPAYCTYGYNGAYKYIPTSYRASGAKWQFNIPISAVYKIEVYVPSYNATGTDVKYKVHYNNTQDSFPPSINQNQYPINKNNWATLGEYYLPEGKNNYVELTWFNDEGASKTVAADAVRATYIRTAGGGESASPPILNPVQDIIVDLGQQVDIDLTATDQDTPLQDLTFSFESVPTSIDGNIVTIEPGHAKLTWTPNEAGEYVIFASVSDGIGQDSKKIRISVQGVIRANPNPVYINDALIGLSKSTNVILTNNSSTSTSISNMAFSVGQLFKIQGLTNGQILPPHSSTTFEIQYWPEDTAAVSDSLIISTSQGILKINAIGMAIKIDESTATTDKIRLSAEYILKCQYNVSADNCVKHDLSDGAINDIYPAPDNSGCRDFNWIVPRENALAAIALQIAYNNTGDERYFIAGNKALDYLLKVQDTIDGGWYNQYKFNVPYSDLAKSPTQTAEVMIALYKYNLRSPERYQAMIMGARYLISCADQINKGGVDDGLIAGGKNIDGDYNSDRWLSDNSFGYQALRAAEEWALLENDKDLASQINYTASRIIAGIDNYFYNTAEGIWYRRLNQDAIGYNEQHDWINYAPAMIDIPVYHSRSTLIGEWIHNTLQTPDGAMIWNDGISNESNRKSPGYTFQAGLVWLDTGLNDYMQNGLEWAYNSGLWQTIPDQNKIVGGWIDWEKDANQTDWWLRFIDTEFYWMANLTSGYDYSCNSIPQLRIDKYQIDVGDVDSCGARNTTINITNLLNRSVAYSITSDETWFILPQNPYQSTLSANSTGEVSITIDPSIYGHLEGILSVTSENHSTRVFVKANIIKCDDDNKCNGISTCQTGTCTQTTAPVTCTALDACHDIGVCNTSTGICTNPAKTNGTDCDDGNKCNGISTCQAGTCTQTTVPVTCTALDACHEIGVCNTSTGVCTNPVKTNGADCDDGNKCNGVSTCQAGTCIQTTAPVVCTALDSCHDIGQCNTGTGVCTNPAKTNGTDCDDGNKCNGVSTCQSGTCTQTTVPVTCTALDACHDIGQCSTGTGVCTNPVKTNGTDCDDGNKCNGISTCQAGTCTQTTVPVVCTALDQCHIAGVCDSGTGVCSNPAKTNGTSCNADSNGCTEGDTCQIGTCVAGATPDCSIQTDQCNTGKCNSTGNNTYTCVKDPTAHENQACNKDSSGCTVDDKCVSGTCVAGAVPDCTAQNDQCNVGACQSTGSNTYICTKNPTPNNGQPCNDGDSCTQTDTCQAGTCKGSNPVVCTALDQCHLAGVCDSGTAVCSNPVKTNGTSCNSDSNGCTVNDTCQIGICVAGATPDCGIQTDQCNTGKCNSTGNNTYTCVKDPTAHENQACNKDSSGCTVDDKCVSGSCIAGAAADCTALTDQCNIGKCTSTSDNSYTCTKDPVSREGLSCNSDSDGCTLDTCQSGSCVVGPAPDCSGMDDQCNTGKCTSTGNNTYVCVKDTTGFENKACNSDSSGCTLNDKCMSGICTAGGHPDCTSLDDQCHQGKCNSTDINTFECKKDDKPEWTACESSGETDYACFKGECEHLIENDACSTAITLVANVPVTKSIQGAHAWRTPEVPCDSSLKGPDAYFTYSPSAGEIFIVKLTPGSSDQDLALVLWKGCGESDKCIQSANTGTNGVEESITTNAGSTPEKVFIQVIALSQTSDGGSYTIVVEQTFLDGGMDQDGGMDGATTPDGGVIPDGAIADGGVTDGAIDIDGSTDSGLDSGILDAQIPDGGLAADAGSSDSGNVDGAIIDGGGASETDITSTGCSCSTVSL